MLVLGDLNENLLKYNEDKQTSEYLDMLLSLGFMPIITKPTRIMDHMATLIDHIYMNTPEKLIKSGLCLADISDHLPVFCTMANTLPTNNERRFFRDFRHFNEDAFHQNLLAVDFKALISNDVNVIFLAICSSQFTVHTCRNSCYNLLTPRCVPTLVYLKQTSLLVFVLLLSLRLYYIKVTFVVSSARTFLLQLKKPLQFVESFIDIEGLVLLTWMIIT